MLTEKQKEDRLAYYRRNKDKITLQRKEYYQNNKEKINLQNKLWRKEHPEKVREFRNKWRDKNPAWDMYHNAKRHAKDQGIPFDIIMKDIIIPERCPVFGIKFSNKSGAFEERPSLDKIIPDLGYTKENIAVISIRANRLKNDGTALEHQQIADYIKVSSTRTCNDLPI